MNGTLYTVSKKPNSTALPSGGVPISFDIKGACSVQAPVLLLHGQTAPVNLFSGRDIYSGAYLSSTGGASINATYDISGYIPVTPGHTYAVNRYSSVATSARCAWYRSDYSRLSVESSRTAAIISLTAPADAAFLRITYVHTQLERVSVTDPAITGGIGDGNYLYIPAWNRYYWIDDIRYEMGEWAISCSCDVLASYKSQIGASSQYVLRSASAYDGKLIDSLYPVKTDPDHAYSSVATGMVSRVLGTEGCFSVGIIGASVGTAGAFGVQYYLMGTDAFNEFNDWLNDSALAHLFADDIANAIQVAITDVAQSLTNLQDYIVNAVWLPISPGGMSVPGVNLGYYGHTLTNTIYVDKRQEVPLSWSLTVPAHPEAAARGDWLNSSAYSQHELYLPGVGMVSLSADDMGPGATITVNGSLSLVDGSIAYQVSCQYGSEVTRLGTYHGMVGVRIPMSVSLSDPVSAGVAAVVGAERLTAGHFLGAAQGLQTAAEAFLPSTRTLGGAGGMHGAYGPGNGYSWLMSRFWLPAGEDITSHGRPLCEVRQISTLSGYVLCENAEISIPGTSAEADAIMNFMNGGFYYE